MQFIFSTNFTTQLSCYIIEDQPANDLPNFHFTAYDSVHSIVARTHLRRPTKITFIGKTPIFKEIEKYYKNIYNGEVEIIWL